MDDDLHDELTDIHGIGDAKAEEIIEVYEEHGVSPMDQLLVEAHQHLEEAIDHFEESEESDITAQQGMERVRRAYDLLTIE